MRPRARRPINRRYFHKKPKIDKRDMAILKKKIGDLNLKKHKKMLEDNKRKKQWYK